ncbi:DUF4157 domain-containing protein [uncultured Litoreibacter sp.]|uniref:eCIS core domain-containing protein n=1 Tax=uncultured Litoreibacter sp. TaxID=1392394 RepID=UPI00262C57B4|nr:DUF4157 domain-containing protein [uncultured Litoreibacter sp.]
MFDRASPENRPPQPATFKSARPGPEKLAALQRKANSSATIKDMQALQRVANPGGLPKQLQSGIEALSGLSMGHVKVHRNSDKPAQVGAHAYAQGSTIHLAPGQDRHLPHEAWHVVQQAQGRVKPTMQAKGVAINDDASLEHEADVMGARAAQLKTSASPAALQNPRGDRPAQLMALHAYPKAPTHDGLSALGVQSVSMPVADYAQWRGTMQRRGIAHGAVAAGDRMVVTQFAGGTMQFWPSWAQVTSILLVSEGVLTVAAGIGAMKLTAGIAFWPAMLGAFAGAAKILRGIFTWPAKDALGNETRPTGKRLVLLNTLRSLEGLLALGSGAWMKDPKVIAFGAIKTLRAAITIATDLMRDNPNSNLRKGLMFLSMLLQAAEAGLVVALGVSTFGRAGDAIAGHAPSALTEGLTKTGGIATVAVGASKAVRSGIQGRDLKDYHDKGKAERETLLPKKAPQSGAAMQLCGKKKKKSGGGGKKGVSYTSIGQHYSAAEIAAAGGATSGHGSGGSGSGQNANTIKQNAELADRLRANRAKAKADKRPKAVIKEKGKMSMLDKALAYVEELNERDMSYEDRIGDFSEFIDTKEDRGETLSEAEYDLAFDAIKK